LNVARQSVHLVGEQSLPNNYFSASYYDQIAAEFEVRAHSNGAEERLPDDDSEGFHYEQITAEYEAYEASADDEMAHSSLSSAPTSPGLADHLAANIRVLESINGTSNTEHGCSHLAEKIARCVADYRAGEIQPITPDLVVRWSQQFPEPERMPILAELTHLLDRYYFSRQRVHDALRLFLRNQAVFGQNSVAGLRRTSFLRVQERGESQSTMLQLVEEILAEDFKIELAGCESDRHFVYIDDALYTGNRTRDDLLPWLNTAPPRCKLTVFHVVAHERGRDYAHREIYAAAAERGVNCRFCAGTQIDDRTTACEMIERIWPRRVEAVDLSVIAYLERLRSGASDESRLRKLFRTDGAHHIVEPFTSERSRDTIEQAFLREGARLVMRARAPYRYMRPLGYEKLDSLGFGALCVMYHNISNASPLALWYGDPTFGINHPFGHWMPLFQRRAQSASLALRRGMVSATEDFSDVPF
jgi:hypothetical protein